MNSQKSHFQQEESGENEADEDASVESDADVSTGSARRQGWSGLQVHSFQGKASTNQEEEDLKDLFIMDSGTTVNFIGNPAMIANRRRAKRDMDLETNAGSKLITEEGDAPGIGVSSFNPYAIANVLSLFEMSQLYRIHMDTAI